MCIVFRFFVRWLITHISRSSNETATILAYLGFGVEFYRIFLSLDGAHSFGFELYSHILVVG